MKQNKNEVAAAKGEICPSCQGRGYIGSGDAMPPVGREHPAGAPEYIPEGLKPDGWLTMEEAAGKLRCSKFWFSRHWKGWGLHPSRLARLLFREEELDALLAKKRVSYRGRPRKDIL